MDKIILSEVHCRDLMTAVDAWVAARYVNDAEAMFAAERYIDITFTAIGYQAEYSAAHAAGLSILTKYAGRIANALKILRGAIDG